ncbi:MAG: hypothetical protein GY703_09225 [Gammaproteobacteria bacterium]|nr:hypothetical protein [Gammaproteobacteria bacterium]
MNELKSQLLSLADRHASQSAYDWLTDSLQTIGSSKLPLEALLKLSAMACRKMGTCSTPTGAENILLDEKPLVVALWSIGDIARVLLLLESCERYPEQSRECAEALFRQGDEQERGAVMRGLMFLPAHETLKHLALEAGRCNSLTLFSAIALDNPYPEAVYSDHEFNQLVLKSLFTGLPIERIQGLIRRSNRKLSKMCEDYADERLAAQRSVPVDIWLAMGAFLSERGVQLLSRHLIHEELDHRYYAVLAVILYQVDIPSIKALLKERLAREPDPEILELVKRYAEQSSLKEQRKKNEILRSPHSHAFPYHG